MTGPAVLTAADSLTCPHTGKVAAATSDRLRVGKAAVLLAPLEGKDVDGCKTVEAPGPPPVVKCLKVGTVAAGASSRLTVRGTSVLLGVLAAVTTGQPPPIPVTVVLGPTRLRAAVKP